MATPTLRNVDESLAKALAERASLRDHTVEQEALLLLRGAVGTQKLSPAERVRRARAIAALGPQTQTTDSLDLLREERSL